MLFRIRRLLHGAIYIPLRDPSQLSVPETGGWIPQQSVWKPERDTHQDSEK